MFRTEEPQKVKQLKPKTVMFVVLWLMVFGVAMIFIAFAGHI